MNKPINIQSFVCEVDKCPDIQRLKAENEELKEEIKQLHRRNPEELYTLFGKPIKYWEELQAENEELKTKIFDEGLRRKTCKYYKQVCSENTQLIAYRNALEEVRELASPKDRLLIVDSPIFKQIQDKINEVLKDERN